MTGLDLFKQGGFIMYPLMFFSIVTWSVGIYKLLSLRKFTKEYKKLNSAVHDAFMARNMPEVGALLKVTHPLVSRPHEILVTNVTKDVMNERIARRLLETNSELKENLWMLGSISASAPFIGLFGTVVGIMGSFRAIGVSGKSGFSVVAQGISESLVATAAGIIVAVVALLFYNFLQSRVNSIAQDFRLKLEELVDIVTTGDHQGR